MDSELRILIFLIRATRMSKKIWWGPEIKSKLNHSLVQIKNPHFLHFQMAISVVDINLLLCEKQKFHDVCLGVSLLLCLMCLKLRGFQIDNWVLQRDLNSENLKVQVYYQVTNYCWFPSRIYKMEAALLESCIVNLKHPSIHTEYTLNNEGKF